MAASESSSQIFRAMQRIAAQEPGWKKVISSLGAAQPIKGRTGEAANLLPGAASGGGTGGGLAAPFTEPNAATRVYWTQREIRSSDAVLSFVVRPIRNVFMVDGASVSVPWNFADPPA